MTDSKKDLISKAEKMTDELSTKAVAKDPKDQAYVDEQARLLVLHSAMNDIPVPKGVETLSPKDAWNLAIGAAQIVVQGKMRDLERSYGKEVDCPKCVLAVDGCDFCDGKRRVRRFDVRVIGCRQCMFDTCKAHPKYRYESLE